jgi:hypothetical protein
MVSQFDCEGEGLVIFWMGGGYREEVRVGEVTGYWRGMPKEVDQNGERVKKYACAASNRKDTT